jgi:intein/homing endonuclease
MKSTGVVGFQIWSDALVQFKHNSLGLILGKKKDITIPKLIPQYKELQIAFLRGFFDTDGCLYMYKLYGKLYPRVEMATISGQLMQQISKILTDLNFRHGLFVEKREKYGWNDLHKIHIRGVNLTRRWFNEIQPQNPKHQKKFQHLIKEQ